MAHAFNIDTAPSAQVQAMMMLEKVLDVSSNWQTGSDHDEAWNAHTNKAGEHWYIVVDSDGSIDHVRNHEAGESTW